MIRVGREPPKGPARAGRGGNVMGFHRLLAAILVVAAVFATSCAVRVGPDGEPLSEDQRITAEVIRIVEDEEGIVSADLRVETRDGVVVFSGLQPALEPVSALLRRASQVRGVVEVVNRIRIIRSAAERSGRDDLYRLQNDDRHHGDDGSGLSVADHAGPRK